MSIEHSAFAQSLAAALANREPRIAADVEDVVAGMDARSAADYLNTLGEWQAHEDNAAAFANALGTALAQQDKTLTAVLAPITEENQK